MLQKYYDMAETAKVLGVSEDDVKRLRQDRKLHGYRDGTDWKFKVEDIDELAAARSGASEDESDILASEVELGESSPGASGTVIGMQSTDKRDTGSDIESADSAVKLGEESKPAAEADIDSKVSQFEELELTLEEDLTLEDSQISEAAGATADGSAVDLSGKELDDDDLVLGGSGAGSDVTIGGDSGISLVDPADSGLSLEDLLDLTGSGGESLELGEDDMIALGEGVDMESPTQLKADDNFELTPLEEVEEEEDSASGSQVIALDTEEEEAPAMGAGAGVAAMLDEDLSGAPQPELAAAAEGIPAVGGAPTLGPAEATLPEMPYSVLNVVSLGLCVVLLSFGCIFILDLMRNMSSWGAPYEINSTMMDFILGLFES